MQNYIEILEVVTPLLSGLTADYEKRLFFCGLIGHETS